MNMKKYDNMTKYDNMIKIDFWNWSDAELDAYIYEDRLPTRPIPSKINEYQLKRSNRLVVLAVTLLAIILLTTPLLIDTRRSTKLTIDHPVGDYQWNVLLGYGARRPTTPVDRGNADLNTNLSSGATNTSYGVLGMCSNNAMYQCDGV